MRRSANLVCLLEDAVASMPSPEPVVFEAQGDPVQAAILVSVIALPFAYWWYVTVPEARIGLAKDKRLQGGETKAYLDALATSDESRPVERWFFQKWLKQNKPSKRASASTGSAESEATVTEGAVAVADRDEESAVLQTPTLAQLFKPPRKKERL